LSQASALPVRFAWATADLSAHAGVDYLRSSGNGLILPGQSAISLPVAALATVSSGSSANFLLQVSAVGNATLASNAAVGTILPGLALQSSVFFAAPADAIADTVAHYDVPVRLDAAAPRDVAVRFSVGGTMSPASFTVGPGTLAIPAGATSGTLGIDLARDNLYKDPKTIIIGMVAAANAGVGSPPAFTLTVNDSHAPPSISVNDASAPLGAPLAFAVVLAQPSGKDVQFTYSTNAGNTSPSLFQATYGSLTIPAGSVSAAVTVPTIDDGLYVGSDAISLDVLSATNATIVKGSATGTIVGQGPLPIAQFTQPSGSVPRNIGQASATVRLSRASHEALSIPFTVGGSAAIGVDHNLAPGTLSIAPGAASASITFNIFDNGSGNASGRTIVIALGAPNGAALGAPSAYTLTIQ
jgi:hypothetical protein